MTGSPRRQLLALIEAPDHVCYRYRLAAYAPRLAAAGWDLAAAPLVRAQAGFLRQLRAVAAADAVVLQRKLLSFWRLFLLRRAAKFLIYDLDDALFWRDSNSAKTSTSLLRTCLFRATVAAADVVTAGNDFLLEHAARQGAKQRAVFFPTPVDPGRYPQAVHARRDGEARLAWIGSRGTAQSLIDAQPQLAAAVQRTPGLQLHLICDWFPPLPGVPVVPHVWSAAGEARCLADADIGVSWLPDHPWSQGKCGLKVLQCMAAGLPVVANRVGVHRVLIEPGVNGFLADTPEEWAAAIARLAESPELRRHMGDNARRLVEERYDADYWGAKFAALLTAQAPGPQSVASAAPPPLPATDREPAREHVAAK